MSDKNKKEKVIYEAPKISLWSRIKKFFAAIRDRLSILTMSRAEKEILNKQMQLSMERSEKSRAEQEQKAEKEFPKDLYNRYLFRIQEKTRSEAEKDIGKMAFDVLNREKAVEINITENERLVLKPDTEQKSVFADYYCGEQLKHNSRIQFTQKGRETGIDSKRSDYKALLTELTEKKEKQQEQKIPEKEENMKEQGNAEKTQEPEIPQGTQLSPEELKEMHLEYAKLYSQNHFNLNPAELTNMVRAVVAAGLDKDDEKKFSRTVVLKNPIKGEPDVKIKAVWDKENQCAKVVYLQDKEEISGKEMIEAWKNAADVRYTIPEWEKDLIPEKQTEYIPEYSLNENRLIKNLANAYIMNVRDMGGKEYPQDIKDLMYNATKFGDMKMMTQLYNCFTSYQGPATELQFHKSDYIAENIQNIDIFHTYGTPVREEILASMAAAVDYTKRLNELVEQPSDEMREFLRDRSLDLIASIERLSAETKLAVSAIAGTDIEKLSDSLSDQYDISMDDIVQYFDFHGSKDPDRPFEIPGMEQFTQPEQTENYVSPVQNPIPTPVMMPQPDIPVQETQTNLEFDPDELAAKMMEQSFEEPAVSYEDAYDYEGNLNEGQYDDVEHENDDFDAYLQSVEQECRQNSPDREYRYDDREYDYCDREY